MSELHILDVGRADCTVLLLDTPDGSRCVVIDGGGKFYKGRRPLLEFLTGRGINTTADCSGRGCLEKLAR